MSRAENYPSTLMALRLYFPLAAVGQMGAVWTGGGTLIAWSSLIAVAGFARVPVLSAVRALLFPVVTGLIVSTTYAVVMWP